MRNVGFKYAVDHNHLELITSDLLNSGGYYTIDYGDFERKASNEKVSLCIFCNPHNPTGRVWSEEELTRAATICLENNVWIVSDEIHCDLLRNGKSHIPLAKLFPNSDRIITCMAPSKTFNMAGFMFSNIIIPNSDLKKIWNNRHHALENPLSIAAAQAAYLEGDEWLSQLKDYLDRNFEFTQTYLQKNLPKSVFRISEATYLAWVNIEACLSSQENMPLYFANNAGVLLEGGNMFVANSKGCIRLNLACPISTLKEGLERICRVLVGC
jgi:cysteine-S-conjugate beta-lyase